MKASSGWPAGRPHAKERGGGLSPKDQAFNRGWTAPSRPAPSPPPARTKGGRAEPRLWLSPTLGRPAVGPQAPQGAHSPARSPGREAATCACSSRLAGGPMLGERLQGSPARPQAGSPGMREGDIPLAEARFTPGAAATTSGRRAGSPISVGVRSTDTMSSEAADENARLVGNSALSDDGMTPLIQVGGGQQAAGVRPCEHPPPREGACTLRQHPGVPLAACAHLYLSPAGRPSPLPYPARSRAGRGGSRRRGCAGVWWRSSCRTGPRLPSWVSSSPSSSSCRSRWARAASPLRI